MSSPLERVLRARRMVRAFEPTPLDPSTLDAILDLARRAPSAGNTQAVEFLVLDSPEATARYWDTTLPAARRATFRWQQLLDAPALIVVVTRPQSYVERYAEGDKARTGLGADQDEWPVPFWWVDAGAAIQNLLLLATDRGLGACLFGIFDHEPAVRAEFDVPADRRLVATVALGHPRPDEPGRSAGRGRAPLETIRHRGHWRPAPPPG